VLIIHAISYACANWSVSTANGATSSAAFGSERLTGAPLDRLTHLVHILEINSQQNHAPNGSTKTLSQGDAEP
jgi:hypothetical protein